MHASSFAAHGNTSRKAAGLLLISALMFAGAARADDREALTAKIMATGPLPCSQDAMDILSLQLRRMEPDLVLQGMRKSMNLGDKWAAGNSDYDQARTLVASIFDADQATNGPFFAITTSAVLTKALATEKPDDLQYLAKFFEKPEGKLFWEESIDGAMCNSWLKTYSRPPYPAMEGTLQQRWEQLTATLKGERERFTHKLNALPKASQSAYYDGAEKITAPIQQAPMQLINERNAELGARLGQILKAKIQDINVIIESFKAKNPG